MAVWSQASRVSFRWMSGAVAAWPHLCGMAHEVIQWSLEEFERGLHAGPTADDVSITVDGRRLDSKTAVLDWWADVAADIGAEEAAVDVSPGG